MSESADRRLAVVVRRLVEPSLILPEQHFGALRRRTAPEERLMVAVLADAVNAFKKYHSSDDAHGRTLFGEARDWLMSEEGSWPFSFRRICEGLGVDASRVRRALLDWCKEQRAQVDSEAGKVRRQHLVQPRRGPVDEPAA